MFLGVYGLHVRIFQPCSIPTPAMDGPNAVNSHFKRQLNFSFAISKSGDKGISQCFWLCVFQIQAFSSCHPAASASGYLSGNSGNMLGSHLDSSQKRFTIEVGDSSRGFICALVQVWSGKKVAIGDTDSDESKVTDFFLRQGVSKNQVTSSINFSPSLC